MTAAIADIGIASCQLNGVKDAKREWFDPVARFREAIDRDRRVPKRVAETFLALSKERKIPSWAMRFFDLNDFVKR